MKLSRSYDSTADEVLMQEVAGGNSVAFSVLYDRYADKMMRYFYRMLGQDREKAEDFTQEVFVKLIEKPHLYDAGKKFSTWLYSIACNMCKNEYRRLAVRKNTVSEEPDPNRTKDENPDDVIRNMDKKTFEKMLEIELGMLDDNHRTTFLLRFQEEMSIKEISDVMGISEGTVKSRLFYTVKKLSEKLKVFDLN